MMKKILFFILCLCLINASAKEYHVLKKGKDSNPGSLEAPFLSIQAASNIA
ncbi:hypothetical protein ACFLSA_05110 [Bacteroidota bacterium]